MGNRKIQIEKIRRETTDGEALYQWLFKGVSTFLLAPSLFLKGYRPPLKTGERLPSGSHCPIGGKNNAKSNCKLKSRISNQNCQFSNNLKGYIFFEYRRGG